MKKRELIIALFFVMSFGVSAQTARFLEVEDCRHVTTDDVPYSSGRVIRAQLKPTTALGHNYGMNLSLSPHSTGGWGYEIQLNFTWSGVVFRRSTDTFGWTPWVKFIMEDTSGDIYSTRNIIARGLLSLGNHADTERMGLGSQLYFRGNGFNTDEIWAAKYNVSPDVSELRFSLGDDTGDRFVVGYTPAGTEIYRPHFVVQNDGKVGIGTVNPYYNLDVNGTLRAKEIKVNLNSGADFVFDPGYQLKPLDEVQKFIKENRHLPEIPTAEEMTNGDTDLGVLQMKLLQKIEELTLYTIRQQEMIEKQQQTIEVLNAKVEQLENK